MHCDVVARRIMEQRETNESAVATGRMKDAFVWRRCGTCDQGVWDWGTHLAMEKTRMTRETGGGTLKPTKTRRDRRRQDSMVSQEIEEASTTDSRHSSISNPSINCNDFKSCV